MYFGSIDFDLSTDEFNESKKKHKVLVLFS